jgi:hypothetical protein
VAQRVGRGIGTPRPHFSPGEHPVPIELEAEWAPAPVWTCAENLAPPPGFDPWTVQPGSSVAIPTELPGPQYIYNTSSKLITAQLVLFMKPQFTTAAQNILQLNPNTHGQVRPRRDICTFPKVPARSRIVSQASKVGWVKCVFIFSLS